MSTKTEIIFPSLELNISQSGNTIVNLSCFISTDNRWWLSEDSMSNIFGYRKTELSNLRAQNKAFFESKVGQYFYDFKVVISDFNLVEAESDLLLGNQPMHDTNSIKTDDYEV